MRVLVLSNCVLNENQGSGYVIMNTAECIRSLGYEVDLIPPSTFSFLPALKNRAKIYRTALGMAKYVLQKKKLLKNYNLIIVYGAESSVALFILKKILKLKMPVLLHSNGLELLAKYNLEKFKEFDADRQNKNWYHFDNSFLFRYCYREIDAILTVSKYDADFAVNNLCIEAKKVFFNEPCLPEIYFSNATHGIEKKRVIMYCGRWTGHKGKLAMEFAIPMILKKFPDYIFRIIGAEENFNASQHFEKQWLDRIEVYPFIKDKTQLINLYRSTSIFLFPSLTEGFGLVLIESMINECAVICGPTGIGGDFKNFEEAIVLNSPGGSEVYSALEKLIKDDTLRLKLSINGKKRVERLHWNNFSKRLIPVLDFLLNKTAS